jgi:hypothetical protein
MAKVAKQFKYYARVGDNRLMAGLMHILIRNDMESYDDCIDEYKTNWGRSPESGGPDTNAKDSHPFNNTEIASDPGRTGYNQVIGDYDVFLYFVTIGSRLEAALTPGTALTGNHTGGASNTLEQGDFTFVTNGLAGQTLKNTTRATSSTIASNSATDVICSPSLAWASGNAYAITNNPEGNTWYSAAPTHAACQSFVRYQLLARHNNAYGHDSNNYLHYGLPVYEYGNTAAGQGAENILIDQALIGGSTRLIVNTSTFSDQSFGTDLSTVGNNTYFAPVSGIEIYGSHGLNVDTEEDTFISGVDHYAIQRHDTTFYNLIVDIDLHGYVNPATDTVAFFRNKTNIFFQPFGESTELQFSTSEFTS